MAEYNQWLDELAKRTGATVENTDRGLIEAKNPEDVAQFQTDLEAQYKRRGASGQTGRDEDSSEHVRAPSDIKKGFGPGGSNENPAGNKPVARQWIDYAQTNTAGTSTGGIAPSGGNSWANQDPRADALYAQLMARSTQSLALDRNDPIIRAQSDSFNANAERSRREHLGDVAERQGPLANMLGEERLTAERLGQRTGGFEAELMGRELTSRRQEIAQALTSMQGILSADQQTALARELAALDAAIRREGLSLQGQQMGQQNDQFNKSLALNEWDMGNKWDYNWAGLGG